MKGIFGWSYPPGCSGPPDDDYVSHTLRCKHCKAFIGGKPARIEPWESSCQCDGTVDEIGLAQCGFAVTTHPAHKEVWDAGASEIFVCKRCKKETKVG